MTNATKRALRLFSRGLKNYLYDPAYRDKVEAMRQYGSKGGLKTGVLRKSNFDLTVGDYPRIDVESRRRGLIKEEGKPEEVLGGSESDYNDFLGSRWY